MFNEENYIIKRNKEIIKELKEKGYTNRLINYKEFKSLYKLYETEMTEQDFANILGITYGNYNTIKNKGTRAKILKEEKTEIGEERKEEIIKELKEKGYANKLIDYQEFKNLYKLYETEMTEQDFANILGIKYSNYMKMKNKGTKAKILKKGKAEIRKERKRKIIKELKEKGYTNKLIDYQEFKSLYELYGKEVPEPDFADILGIKYSSYMNMKNCETKAKILKEEKTEIGEERKGEIIKELKEKGYANKLIDYQEFKSLYKLYETEMTEQDFANILGITDNNYMNIKNKERRTKIDFKRKELDRIKIQLSESREYSRAELEDICNKYSVALYELLKSMYGNENIINILSNRDSIYIGKCEMPKEFKDQYAKELLDASKRISKEVTKKYNLTRYADDFSSDALIYILQNKGDIVKNADNEKQAIDVINASISVFVKYSCLKKLRLKRHISLDDSMDNYSNKKYTRTRHELIGDTSVDIEDEVEKKQLQEEYNNREIFEKMKEYYSKGMNNTQVIKKIIEEYKISREDLLVILEELIKQKENIELEDDRN